MSSNRSIGSTMFLQSLFKMGTPDPLRRALEHLDAGEPRTALALLEVASASEEPAIADTGRLYAAEVLLQLGEEILFEDPEGARAFFARAAEHQPGWADIHHRLGRIAMQAGEFVAAARHLDQAMAINPDYLVARLDRVETILEGATGVMEDHFLRLRELCPAEHAESLEDLDSLIVAANKDAAIDRIAELRLQLRSVHRERRAIAERCVRDQKPDEALAILDEVMEECGRFPDLLHLAGLAWAQKNEPARAEDCFREALGHNPRFVRARVNLGLALMDQMRVEDAESEFLAVLDVSEDHPLALAALEELGVSVASPGSQDVD
jgi:tetratricopeptide (TPR) repeat protein